MLNIRIFPQDLTALTHYYYCIPSNNISTKQTNYSKAYIFRKVEHMIEFVYNLVIGDIKSLGL